MIYEPDDFCTDEHEDMLALQDHCYDVDADTLWLEFDVAYGF
jgi:hypothetical protein